MTNITETTPLTVYSDEKQEVLFATVLIPKETLRAIDAQVTGRQVMRSREMRLMEAIAEKLGGGSHGMHPSRESWLLEAIAEKLAREKK